MSFNNSSLLSKNSFLYYIIRVLLLYPASIKLTHLWNFGVFYSTKFHKNSLFLLNFSIFTPIHDNFYVDCTIKFIGIFFSLLCFFAFIGWYFGDDEDKKSSGNSDDLRSGSGNPPPPPAPEEGAPSEESAKTIDGLDLFNRIVEDIGSKESSKEEIESVKDSKEKLLEPLENPKEEIAEAKNIDEPLLESTEDIESNKGTLEPTKESSKAEIEESKDMESIKDSKQEIIESTKEEFQPESKQEYCLSSDQVKRLHDSLEFSFMFRNNKNFHEAESALVFLKSVCYYFSILYRKSDMENDPMFSLYASIYDGFSILLQLHLKDMYLFGNRTEVIKQCKDNYLNYLLNIPKVDIPNGLLVQMVRERNPCDFIFSSLYAVSDSQKRKAFIEDIVCTLAHEDSYACLTAMDDPFFSNIVPVVKALATFISSPNNLFDKANLYYQLYRYIDILDGLGKNLIVSINCINPMKAFASSPYFTRLQSRDLALASRYFYNRTCSIEMLVEGYYPNDTKKLSLSDIKGTIRFHDKPFPMNFALTIDNFLIIFNRIVDNSRFFANLLEKPGTDGFKEFSLFINDKGILLRERNFILMFLAANPNAVHPDDFKPIFTSFKKFFESSKVYLESTSAIDSSNNSTDSSTGNLSSQVKINSPIEQEVYLFAIFFKFFRFLKDLFL